MKINSDLSSIHAYLCADGYVIKNPKTQKHKYYYIGLRNQNIILLKDFQDKFYNFFKIKPHIVEGRCRIGSKEIYHKLTENFDSFYSKDWKLPKLNKKNLKYWLRSYFDCEAWVRNKERQNRYIGIDSINQKGLIQIQKALLEFDINSNIKKRNKRNTYTLHIYSKDNLIKFQKEINFLHPNKSEKLKKAINSYMDYKWYVNKNNFKKIMKEKAKFKKGNNVIRLCSILKINLKEIKNFLNKLKTKSKIYKTKNGLGTIYYELSIYGKENINKLISMSLIKR